MRAAIPFAARSIVEDDHRIRAILCHTRSGSTAQLIAAERPRTPVYAFGENRSLIRRLAFTWGITPMPVELTTGPDLLERMEAELVGRGQLTAGDVVAVVATLGNAAHANMLVLHEVQTPGGASPHWEGA